MSKNISAILKTFGETIRQLRDEQQLPLRTVAAYLGIDVAILSKIERGQRRPTREQVVQLAEYFKADKDELLVAWLSDKLVYELENDKLGLRSLQMAEEKVAYNLDQKLTRKTIIDKIHDFLEEDRRVEKAWIFGSFARNEHTTKSDLDLMVRFKIPRKVSLFDYAEIAHELEQRIGVKIDLVEEGCIKDFAWETAKHDLTLIYG